MRGNYSPYDRNSFYFRILKSDSFIPRISGYSFLDDVKLSHWARKIYIKKRKQITSVIRKTISWLLKSWEYFGSSIASKLRSKKLAL